MIKLFTLYVYLQTLFCGCGSDMRNSGFERLRSDYKVKIKRIGRLHEEIKESSGLARASDSTYWTHPDGGQRNVIYLIDLNGNLLQTVKLPIPNKDWEDLAQDTSENLFIGDFGNNTNMRRDLVIYKLQLPTMQVTDTINFRYADQKEFPPPYRQRHYDLEAFFYSTDSLYLFTKSRSYKGVTKLYTVPAYSGNYELKPRENLQVKSPVTAAAIAPSQQEFALLGYGRMYLFQPKDGAISLAAKRYCLTVGRTGQAEAILYISDTQLLITNEKGKLYLVTLEKK